MTKRNTLFFMVSKKAGKGLFEVCMILSKADRREKYNGNEAG